MEGSEISTLIQSAVAPADFAVAEAAIAVKAQAQMVEAQALGVELVVASAPLMFLLKDQIDRSHQTPHFILEAQALRQAGYPEVDTIFSGLGAAFSALRDQAASGALRESEVTRRAEEAGLAPRDTVSLRRLARARAEVGAKPFEARWRDMALAPTARAAYAELQVEEAEIAAARAGGDGVDVDDRFHLYLDAIERAGKATEVDVIVEEAGGLPGRERRVICHAARRARLGFAAAAFGETVRQFGWAAVQVMYLDGSIQRGFANTRQVAEYQELLGAVAGELAAIRRADAKFGRAVMKLAWERAGERISEKQGQGDAAERLAARLDALN